MAAGGGGELLLFPRMSFDERLSLIGQEIENRSNC